MRHFMVATLAACSALLATSAFAQVQAYSPFSYSSPNSVYISGDAGYGTLSTPKQSLPFPDDIISGSSDYKIGSFAGGGSLGYEHAINRNLLVGAELGYDYNGQSKYTENYTDALFSDSLVYKVTSQDFHALVTGTYLFNNGFNVFAKGGAARVDQALKVDSEASNAYWPSSTYEDHLIGYKPMAATGIGYRFRMVDIYAQYSHIFGTDADSFQDLVDNNGNLKNIVSTDAIKLGASVRINI